MQRWYAGKLSLGDALRAAIPKADRTHHLVVGRGGEEVTGRPAGLDQQLLG
jgi:hypothetical protein